MVWMERKLNPNVQKAYDYLLAAITSFEMAPGQAVSDTQIAKVLGISRSPVRDAIMLLQSDGLVSMKDGKTVVAPITLEDIADILHVRATIESECIRMIAAAGWLSPEKEMELNALQKEISDCAESGRISEHYDADDRFHMLLVSLSGSSRFVTLADTLRLQMQRVRWLNRAVPERMKGTVDEHAELLEALLSRDENRAVSVLCNHLKKSEDSFRSVLSDKAPSPWLGR